ncbi:MAG: hypothetical protein WCH85_02210 [Methanomicrobiales archaeon]
MKPIVLILLSLLIAGILVAGCTQGPVTPVAVPTPTAAVAVPVTTTSAQQPSFTMGRAYLNDPYGYSFQSESDVIVKEFRVDDPSWGFDLKITTLNDDLQYCWFTMDVMDVDSGHVETFGYGRQYSINPNQQIPMYKTGPYKITLKGNRVKVLLKAAVREP